MSTDAWRLIGASHIALGISHVFIWRRFGWSQELSGLSPLTARVFAVHTFFIVFVLVALGLLMVSRPELLASGDLARLVLATGTVFWTLRLIAQPLVFDSVMLVGSPWRMPLRIAAMALFALYAASYGFAWTHLRS